jgi:prepilin-type N-terminal cleavage/methylation domain-containing protein
MKRGFTLIEILVATAIMAVTIGVTVAGYNNFNESQRVKQAALTFKNNLRMAQEQAKSAQKPADLSDCFKLVGIRVRGVIGGISYQIRVECKDDSNLDIYSADKIYNLPTNVKFNTDFSILFQPLTQGVSGGNSVTIESSMTPTTSIVSINNNGEISVTNY